MSGFPQPMGAAEELARAEELISLRRELWVGLLDYPPFAEAIVESIAEQLRDEAPKAALERLRLAAIAVRERDVRETLGEYALARDHLAESLHRHRAEAALARTLVADVRAVASRRAARRTTTLLAVRNPPRGSQVFRRYLASVRRAESDLTVARQRFVAANLRLVVTISRRYNNGFLTQSDLIQEGTLGLLRAVDGYDPARGTRFSTYAAWWIKHGITRAVANHGLAVRVPANVLGLRSQLRRLEHSFMLEQGRSPSDRELARLAGTPTKTVANARRAVMNGVELPEDGDWIADEGNLDLDTVLDEPVVAREMFEAVDELPGIEGAVIRKRFALDGEQPLTLAEIGELHCLSRERIRQIEKQALGRMRGVLESRGVCM